MMNLITVRDLRNRSGEIWRRLAQQQELIVTSNGRPIALLTPVSEDNVEKTLAVLRRARAQVAVSRMRETAATTGANRLTLDDVKEEIHKARQERSV
jgi:prevent-host-death family protein